MQSAIDERRGILKAASIADAKERRELLTTHARSTDNPFAAIRAIDTLNKMDGVYIERHQHEGGLTLDVTGARERPPALWLASQPELRDELFAALSDEDATALEYDQDFPGTQSLLNSRSTSATH